MKATLLNQSIVDVTGKIFGVAELFSGMQSLDRKINTGGGLARARPDISQYWICDFIAPLHNSCSALNKKTLQSRNKYCTITLHEKEKEENSNGGVANYTEMKTFPPLVFYPSSLSKAKVWHVT